MCMCLVQTFTLKFADNLSDCNFFLNELYRVMTHYQRKKTQVGQTFQIIFK